MEGETAFQPPQAEGKGKTHSVKDRLTGYFYGNDAQCLEQAIMVAQNNTLDMSELRRWSENEGKREEFEKIAKRLKKASRRTPPKSPAGGLYLKHKIKSIKAPLRGVRVRSV
jgi:hypothetical protein